MQAWVKCEVKNIASGLMFDVSFPTESGRKLSLKEISSGLTRRPAGIKQGEWGKGSLSVEMEEPSSGPWDMVQLPKVSEEGMEFVAVKKEDFGLYQEERAVQTIGEWDRMANATMESYVRSVRESLSYQAVQRAERLLRGEVPITRVSYTILPPGTVVRPGEQAVAQPVPDERLLAPENEVFMDPDDQRHDPATCSLCLAYERARASGPFATGAEMDQVILQERAAMVQERLAEVR